MATRKLRLGITVGIPDPDKSIAEILDGEGRTIRPPTIAVRHVPPGELVELDEDEADALEARFPWREPVIIDPSAPVITRVRG